MQVEEASETSPLQRPSRNESRFSSSIIQTSETYGKPFFAVLIALSAIIPAFQLGLGVHYEGQCPVDERISTYMIVAGGSGLILAGFCAGVVGTFLFISSKSMPITRLVSSIILSFLLVIGLLAIFAFIWFVFGCVWILGAHKHVQFIDPTKANYCLPAFYKSSFSLLIITFVWAGIQCCVTCFRQCCVGESG